MRSRSPRSTLKPGQVSLERALSKLGLASRTQARALILENKVAVNGRIVSHPGIKVVPERVKITINGQERTAAEPLTIVLHKPKGLVTTRSDEKGRPTIYSLLGSIQTHLGPVGRLDMQTSGLLILTNDTQFAAWLTDPKHAVTRVYLATVRGELSDEVCEVLVQDGVRDEGELLKAQKITIQKRSKAETHLFIELVEGKNREIRRMFKKVGHEITRLKRISFGGLALGDLEPGQWRKLDIGELKAAFPRAPFKLKMA